MNLSVANLIAGILSGMKINRVEDKRAKAALLKDYLALRKACKEAEADKNEIITKFQDDWRDELASVQAFREKNRPVVGHNAYIEAEKDANKAIADIFSREVDIDLTPVDMVAFAGISDDLTLEQVAILQENGIIAE